MSPRHGTASGCGWTRRLPDMEGSCEYRVFQKEFYNGIPNVAVWRLLRKRLHLKAYKLSIAPESV
jgi:hypothetical protein